MLNLQHPSFLTWPKRFFTNMSTYTKYLHEIRTHGCHLTDRLEVDEFEYLQGLNNQNKNVFEQNENKTLTQHHVSENLNKKNFGDNLEDNPQDIHEDNQLDILVDKQQGASHDDDKGGFEFE